MQDIEIKADRTYDIRKYLQRNLTFYDFERLHLIFKVSPHRLSRMLNNINTTIWSFDQIVILIEKLDLDILPSEFLKQSGLVHNLSELQVQALDHLIEQNHIK